MEIHQAIEAGRSDPSIFAREILGLDLNPIQERWFKETSDPSRKRCILVPSNQCGKSVASAILHIWHAFYKPRLDGTQEQRMTALYPTLNISPNSNQMRAMFNYMEQIMTGEFLWKDPKTGNMRTNDCKIKWFLKKKTENPMPIIFWENGSIFYGRSVHDDRGKGLAGGQYAFITYDECVLSHHLKDEVTGNIYSRLMKYNGILHLIGTPNSESPSNQYYLHIVKKGLEEKEGWYAMRGSYDENIFFSKKDREEVKKNLRQMNPDQYRQAVYGDFIEASSGYFSPQQVDDMFKDGITWQEPIPGHRYILSVDWAFAKNDYTVMIVVDFSQKPYRVVKIVRFQGHEHKPQEQYALARSIQRAYDADFITDASGGLGTVVLQELSDIVTQAFTFGGTGSNKAEMLLYLKEMMAVGELVCPYDMQLEEELGTYKEDDKKLTQDMVMALGMASWYIKENYSDDNHKKILEINLFR